MPLLLTNHFPMYVPEHTEKSQMFVDIAALGLLGPMKGL